MQTTGDMTSSPQIEAWAAALSRREEVALHRSRLKSVLLALVMLVVGLIGLALGLAADLVLALVGWLLVLVSIVSVVVLVRRALSRQPAAVVTAEGITVGRGTAGPIPWSQITDVSVMRSGASSFVILAVTEQERRRQSGDSAGVELDLARTEEESQPVMWLPNGLAADENELAIWLTRELTARQA
ncbi:STM3941 family protein [Brachybacterium sp. AOP29-B2-41]|uniref:STM3941 family protein n=1 Tax=Brachybacterium sp. AOP29-B2-41 TaxID=3457704 RepID=UPI0040331A40